jgi:TolB-like protein
MFRRASGRPRLSIGAGFGLGAIMLGLAAGTTTPANAQAATGNTLTVVVAPFANNDKEHRGGRELAKWAEDAVAVELANSGRFEVIKRSEVERQARDMGIDAPYTSDELRQIATALGANAVVTGQLAYVQPRMRKGLLEGAEVGLTIGVEEGSYGDLTNGAAAIGLAPVKPRQMNLDALERTAITQAAAKSVRDLQSTMLVEGTVLLTQTSLTGDKRIHINRGSRDGLEEGMEMIVQRNGQRVGRIRLSEVFASDSEATVIGTTQGIAPMDHVRAVFPMPVLRAPR